LSDFSARQKQLKDNLQHIQCLSSEIALLQPLADEISTALGENQFKDVVRQWVEHVNDSLDRLGSFNRLAPPE
jgi:hypothetical protein